MGFESSIATEDEKAGREAIARASALLAGRGASEAGALLPVLFHQAAPEDLIGYNSAELAALAEQALSFLTARVPGHAKIKVSAPDLPVDSVRLKGVSVVEIANDDMPFLVDSVMGALTELGLTARLVVHPILTVERDPTGRLNGFHEDARSGDALLRESLIHIHVDRIEDETRREAVTAEIEQVLAEVRVAVGDWRAMLGRVGEVISHMKSHRPPLLPVDETAEAIQFLEWLVANNFTFLGVRDHLFNPQTGSLDARLDTGLGILRDPERGRAHLPLTPELRAVFAEPKALFITKTTAKSRVHRRVFMDYIGVKRYDQAGRPVGELRIFGLFTSSAYTGTTKSIPYLRRKIDGLLARFGFNPAAHSGKALINMLETYPRDELLQIDDETLYRFSAVILQLEERPRIRALARRDRFDRFVSVLVYLPRDRSDSQVVGEIGKFLAGVFKGAVASVTPFFPEGPLVRFHFIVSRSDAAIQDTDRAALEYGIGAIVRTWSDALSEALALAHDPDKSKSLYERYRDAFSPGYRHRYLPSVAVGDIRIIEILGAERPLWVEFRGADRDDGGIGLKVWSFGRPIPLSERVPILENMGFRVVDESTFDIAPVGGIARVWLHDMVLERENLGAIDIGEAKQPLENCLLVVMTGGAENDGYNALVLEGGLRWRDVVLIRTLSRYLRQIRVPFSQDYMWTTLRKHAGVAAILIRLFQTRFDHRLDALGPRRDALEESVASEIEVALLKVQSLDEDRIIRHFVNAIRSAVRTNFYQIGKDGRPHPQIAIKFDSRKIDELPLPRPLYEIFVYSPRVEGIHLRFGKVARGGIRWSDRPQDFRTEVLGLVKAQQVKNAVIVPVGAKGGFVPKKIPAGASRDTVQAEGVAAYRLFIGTLLGITDNISGEAIVPPDSVARHDGDDPYLVVAADKGTATFSDIANEISVAHGFWLGDAFASGGSAGYDHKKMGITARGAWEAVKRHFREMNVDIATTPFAVAGVGDMSGDVFGNGMLRERTIRLVAAFDHRDIFIDPDPDPETSFNERSRLFGLPRSSWQDYDRSLISAGGGVYSRSAKEIELSPQAQSLLGLSAPGATPQQVMRAILAMPSDLLWFGGIGTYVRASAESDEAAGDRANDPLRIAASELRCKVIGEGANLGMTQPARIEAGLRGVRLNTDAIDNSAGVNTSDIEVNIKIALSESLRTGELTLEARNTLLGEMTDEVAELVLRNNYLQTLSISLAERRGLDDLGFQQRLMQVLERRNLLDRAVEFLPDDMSVGERRRRSQPLTRPELAVLLAYAKLTLFSDLLDSGVPDDPYLARELGRYFPARLSQLFPEALQRHRLRREIIATHLANSVINRGGPSLVVRMADETGATASEVASAFAAVRDSYGMTQLNTEIDALDARIAGDVQLELYATVQDLLLDRLVWFLRHVDFSGGLAKIVAHYAAGISEIARALQAMLPAAAAGSLSARKSRYVAAGVPDELALKIASLPLLGPAADIVHVADRVQRPVVEVAATYFAARDFFRIERIAESADRIATADYFDRLALDRARDGVGLAVQKLAAEMMAGGGSGAEAVKAWTISRGGEAERIRSAVHEIAETGLTLSKLSVAASLLNDLARK